MKIFTASTGRCGTGFLSECFKHYTYIAAFHEQPPVLAGKLLEEINNTNAIDNELLIRKAKAIARNPFYIDTAHQYMRGYYKYALAYIPNHKVIKLSRHPAEVISSRMNRNIIPGNNGWVLKPTWRCNTLKIKKQDWGLLSNPEKIAWDWLEVENRFWKNKHLFGQISYLKFDDLTSTPYKSVKKICDEFGIKHCKLKNSSSFHRNSNKESSSRKYLPEFQSVVKYLDKKYDLSWLKDPHYDGDLYV